MAAEPLIRAITLIPGAGERAYDPLVYIRETEGGTARENDHNSDGIADWNEALDALRTALPNVDTVYLVVGWFGDDLRCGHCRITPRVEFNAKTTAPGVWRVHTVSRAFAPEVSRDGAGILAYGGTPSDDSVVRAVRDLRARGYTVRFYPFVFMDIAPGNSLPSPHGGATQPPYPWRGRITCHPAAGQPGTVDKTAAAAVQVDRFFGSVVPAQISVGILFGVVVSTYLGPSEWSYRRMILHYARLCAAINAIHPGSVDAFLIGSELRELCSVRDSAATFPAVAHLVQLAVDVKGIVGDRVRVGYGADWSDYSGYRPADGGDDVFFHLDLLWACNAVDFVGIDWYAPLADWRDGTDHLDYLAGAASIYDLNYLRSGVEGGEYFDWYYASYADRAAQVRTPITDGAYGKPWVYRTKDIRSWWTNRHFNRPGGVESGTPTAWVPQSKPIWLCEWGCPSVDKGPNQPNVFYDPKSSESFLPYFSAGTVDNLVQNRTVEALLSYWEPASGNNPVSAVYGGPMLDSIAVWTWDARPYPAWPTRTDIWSDGELWEFGHWLNGKTNPVVPVGASFAAYIINISFAGVGPVRAAPENIAQPTISGTAAVGKTLVADAGAWTGYPAPAYARQWERNGAPIPGATASTYTLVPADAGATIAVTVTATNSEGSPSATSAGVGPVLSRADQIRDALFGAGEQGGMWDMTDPATMWQDAAGTIPVTAYNDPIGRVADTSGNGNHLVQAVAPNRPGMGMGGAAFNGSSGFLASAAPFDLTAGNAASACASFSRASPSAFAAVFETSENSGSATGTFAIFSGWPGGAQPYDGGRIRGTSAGSMAVGAAAAGNFAAVVSFVGQISPPSRLARRDGVQVGTDTLATGSGTLGSHTLYVGARAGSSARLNGSITRLIICGRVVTPQEIALIEAWCDEPLGVLP